MSDFRGCGSRGRGNPRGRDNNQRGRDNNQQGRDNNQRGRDNNQQGRDNNQRGRDNNQRGRDNNQRGRDNNQRGRDNNQRGRDNNQRGRDNNQRGRDNNQRGRGNNQPSSNPNYGPSSNHQSQNNYTERPHPDYRLYESYITHEFESLNRPHQSSSQHRFSIPNHEHHLSLQSPNIRNVFGTEQPSVSGFTPGHFRPPGPIPQQTKHHSVPQQQCYTSEERKTNQNTDRPHFKSHPPSIQSKDQYHNKGKSLEQFKFPYHAQRDHFNKISPKNSEAVVCFPSHDQIKFKQNTAQLNTPFGSKQDSAERNTHEKKKQCRKKNFKSNANLFWVNKKKKQQCEPQQQNLFSFSRVSKTSVSTVLSEESDDDSVSVVSTHSSMANDESVISSDESEESMQSSLFSKKDHMADLKDFEFVEKSDIEYTEGITFRNNLPIRESYISVFWDIENCPVPSNKSATDIVKKVRDAFYEHRTEEEFIVACDTRNLDKLVDRELNEAHVTIIHANSQNKNAADCKLQGFLHKFQVRHRQTNSAIVLISGDSDFAPFLHELRYQNLIFVNLICNTQARKSLRVAAQKCVLYTDFLEDLPDQAMEEKLFFCLVISNLPDFVKKNAIKANLEEKMKSINGKVKLISNTEAEIIFMNQAACEKAFRELQGYSIYGAPIDIKMEARSSDKETVKQVKCKIKKSATPTLCASFEVVENSKSREIDKRGNINQSSEKAVNKEKVVSMEKLNSNEDNSKKATMYIFVSQYPGNQQYWEKEFKQIFSENNLVVQWLENDFERYFLVTFLSLSKAQKGKKALLKRQTSDLEGPKFVKIIKGVDSLNIPVAEIQNLTQVKEQINEKHIHYIKNKEAKCLKEFKEKFKKIGESHNNKNNTPDEQVAFQDKRNELNEQKITFTNFTEQICQKMKDLSGTEKEMEIKANELMREYSRECVCLLTALPIYARKNTILKKVKAHQVIVLQAETGSGKSTQVCQYLWRENFGEKGMIICTQPRKIAAISIASHVSSQIGCAVGGIVGYQVGLSKRRSDATKILYVTDFTMLKMCTEKPLFEGISCIMIDEAHERSVYTDLLLGMVKQAVKLRPDLHIIITSATIQCSLFQSYFTLPDSAIYHVPGRSFPIEDIWLENDVTLGWDYLGKTVKLTYQLLQEATGNILAFLTTPIETEKASEQLQDLLQKGSCKFDIHVLQLHGKLDVNEQRKVFEKTKPNVRKVVFSTNCAETSITIPGITYVVDCGMVKEAQYDAGRNLNILSVGFANKSSAEQRRGRAGRTQSGKCFRLYSKANYETNMADRMVPEILRTNLGQALLKLMILGIKDPSQFDFIESPSTDSMDAAVKQLVHLGAINCNDMSLTDLGQQMSALPLEPRLCYVILKAIEKDIGYDAVVIAALATVSRNIFFRNSGNSKEADVKKIRFCQSESDFFTFLEIYKEWSETPKTEKTRWCVRNCINARSMRLVHDLVNELILTLSKELNSTLSIKFSQHENIVELMHELICFSFSENICVFSGHPKLGYRCFNVPETLFIHPSSSLCSLGTWRPQYIVYDAILKTSQTFLINITVFKESTFFENMANNDSMKTTFDCLKSMMLTPYVFCGLGDDVLKTILGKKASKLKKLENELKNKINSEYCATEVDFSSGKLSIFIPSVHYSQLENIFLPRIKEIQANLFSWEQELHEVTGLPNLRAVVGAGMEMKEILLPDDFRDVIITPVDCDFSFVMEELRKCGEIRFFRKGTKYHKVSFKNAANAKNAVKVFDTNDSVKVKPVNIPSYCRSLPFFKILIRLTRRLCTGRAFFNVKPSTSLSEASHCLLTRLTLYHGFPLKITLSKKVAEDFCLSNLPEIINREELISILNANLPSGIQVNKFIAILKPEFKSKDAEIELIKNKILEMFSPFTYSKRLHVDLKNPNPKDKDWQAIVYFENPQDGQIAVNVLKSRKSFMSDMEKSILTLNPLLETSLVCHNNVFFAIKEQINDAVQFFNNGTSLNDKLEIEAKLKDDGINVLIQITSNNIADINDARKRLLTLIQGDQIHCLGTPHLETLFTTKGQNFVADLVAKTPESYINIDKRSKILSIFGSDATCTSLKFNLNSFLDDVEKENFEEIQLKLMNSPKSILKEVITKYGFDLSGLQTECTLSSAEIDVYKHILTISGKRDSIEQCKMIISAMQSDVTTDVVQNNIPIEECPVCCSERDELFHRLEYCGHVYCKFCLLLQVKSCQSFPICCCKEGCNQPLVLRDIQWAIETGKVKEKDLHSKAFKYFMANAKDINYCPTPDCPMVYRVTYGEEYSESYCPQCCNSICTRCCVLYHAGMSCDFYQSFKVDDNHTVQVWMNADSENHKLCPSCKSPIEKNGGCTHMTCWKCKCHMCWRCMETFPSGDDVYTHQASCPVMLRAMYSN